MKTKSVFFLTYIEIILNVSEKKENFMNMSIQNFQNSIINKKKSDMSINESINLYCNSSSDDKK